MSNNESFETKLENILNKSDSLPFLFIGSGFSRRYLGLPNWRELLEYFAKVCLPGNPLAFMTYQYKAGDNSLPKIAELIEKDFNDNWYKNISNVSKQEIEFVKRTNASPFKCKVSDYINSFKTLPNQGLLADELALFGRIAKRSLSGVITTNYDCLLEKLLSDYTVYCNQDELLFSPLQDVYEIYKIHGSTTQPSTIVLTQKDYEIQDKKTTYLAAKLLTIFVEHPIIFIGYSVNDSDIRKILYSISQCLTEKQLIELKNRFLFINWTDNKQNNEIGELQYPFENGKYFPMTQLNVVDYKAVFSVLTKKQSVYDLSLLRRLKHDVYKVILNNEEKAEKYISIWLDSSNNTNIKKVIGVSRNSEQEQSMPKGDDLYLDIVFDNKNYDATMLINKSLETLLKRNSNSLPVYKYILKYQHSKLPRFMEGFINNTGINKFFDSDSVINKRSRHIYSQNDFENKFKDNGYSALHYFDLIDLKDLNKDKLHTFLQNIIEKELDNDLNNAGTYKSQIRKMIKVLDWLIYGEEVIKKFSK